MVIQLGQEDSEKCGKELPALNASSWSLRLPRITS